MLSEQASSKQCSACSCGLQSVHVCGTSVTALQLLLVGRSLRRWRGAIQSARPLSREESEAQPGLSHLLADHHPHQETPAAGLQMHQLVEPSLVGHRHSVRQAQAVSTADLVSSAAQLAGASLAGLVDLVRVETADPVSSLANLLNLVRVKTADPVNLAETNPAALAESHLSLKAVATVDLASLAALLLARAIPAGLESLLVLLLLVVVGAGLVALPSLDSLLVVDQERKGALEHTKVSSKFNRVRCD